MSSRCRFSTHCASIASASVSLTTRTGSFSSSASFAALRRRAPATTSYLLSSSSRTRRGARIPWVLKLAAFCVVGDFVAEDAKRPTGTGGARAEGHITVTGSRAISGVPHLCAIHHFGVVVSKLQRAEGKPQQRPSFLSG